MPGRPDGQKHRPDPQGRRARGEERRSTTGKTGVGDQGADEGRFQAAEAHRHRPLRSSRKISRAIWVRAAAGSMSSTWPSKKIERVADAGDYDDALPAWSPDGRQPGLCLQAPCGRRTATTTGTSIVVEPHAGRHAQGPDHLRRAGRRCAGVGEPIAGLESGREDPSPMSRAARPRLIEYGVRHLAVVPADGGPSRLVTPSLDRNIAKPRWSRRRQDPPVHPGRGRRRRDPGPGRPRRAACR